VYIQIPHLLKPRHYQLDFLNAVAKGMNVCSVIHRRAGKDTISIQAILLRALQVVGVHIYLAPLLTQIRQIAWSGITGSGMPFISYIPECLIAGKNDARMEIKLINGSIIKFSGSNNFDSLMGTNPQTIIYSEYSLHHPLARQYLNPILIENGGLEVLQFTPRGKMNHGYDVLQVVKNNPNYLVQVLGVDDTFNIDGTPVITKQQINEAAEMGMSKEMIRQEFYASFDIGTTGAYYTQEMQELEFRGGLKFIEPIRSLPLMLNCDLGGVDSTCFILFQVVGSDINILKIIVDSGKGLQHYMDEADKYRKSIGCPWGNMFAPHDIAQRSQDWASAESRLLQARKAGWNFLLTPKLDVADGIEASKFALRFTNINIPECDLLVRALREYQRTYDEVKRMYSPKPLHNWASHIADAYRYLAINYKRLNQSPMPMTSYSYSD